MSLLPVVVSPGELIPPRTPGCCCSGGPEPPCLLNVPDDFQAQNKAPQKTASQLPASLPRRIPAGLWHLPSDRPHCCPPRAITAVHQSLLHCSATPAQLSGRQDAGDDMPVRNGSASQQEVISLRTTLFHRRG